MRYSGILRSSVKPPGTLIVHIRSMLHSIPSTLGRCVFDEKPYIHGYFSVDLEVVWKTVQRYIPELEKQIEALKREVVNK